MVKTVDLTIPMTADEARSLRAGDMVSLSGSIVTGRDRIHKLLLEERISPGSLPFPLAGAVLYHCGPIMQKQDDGFRVVAAGPTTSQRLEMYEADLIRQYGLRGIMGKGGMGEQTREALKEQGCVYLHTIGGAAAYLADRVTKVLGVWKLEELGLAEAMWHLQVKDFPAMVTMDSLGNDLHRDLEADTLRKFTELIGK
ncbi:MAG: fumarate hydrolyase [Nitrospirae bacterium]|nr:MAG: fumarate hydrolyase [Nitrospirota bacterium]